MIRVVIAVASAVLVAGSLAGCSHRAVTNQAVSVTSASTATAVPTTAGSDASLQDVQNDLNAANSATANADGDVADADSSAGTNDSP
jgi:uncharacterized lipoprotein